MHHAIMLRYYYRKKTSKVNKVAAIIRNKTPYVYIQNLKIYALIKWLLSKQVMNLDTQKFSLGRNGDTMTCEVTQ